MFDAQSLSSHAGERTFTVERVFAAPRELMFRMFTQPEHLKRWWAPRPYTVPTCRIDLRPGGLWHYSMRSPEGEEHWARAVYHEIVPPEKLVYTSTLTDAQGNPTQGVPEHQAIISFVEENGKTRVSALIEFANPTDLQMAAQMGMVQGMNMTWDSLIEYVQELQAK
jgi:uncharacterized protein YndB with AHSA1/START domain